MPTTTTTEGSKEGKSKESRWRTLPDDLAALSFYVGFLPRDAVESLLKNDGNYVIWAEERERGSRWCFMLAVQTKTGKVRHLNLNFSPTDGEKCWTVEMMKEAEKYRAPTITELVSALHQKADISFTDGSEPIKLVKSVKRSSKLFCECKDLKINGNRLGEGNFCNVILGKLVTHGSTDKPVAIKACKDIMPDAIEDHIALDQKELFMEAKTLSKLQHPNIIEFLGIICFKPPIKIVMEFCPGGSLFIHLQKHAEKISVGERLLYMFEVARGMYYLEQRETIHRDLAARNCLISKDSTIKIADFGLSITKKAAVHERCQKLRVPIRQMAPETIGRQPRFSNKSDVWAYGMFIWEVFSNGQKAWIDEEVKFIAQNIKERNMPTLPANSPREVFDIVADCWELEIEKRPSFKQLTEVTSKLVQDPKFALPPISARTICVYKGLNPRKSDDFEIEATVKNSPRSLHAQTETQQSPADRRRQSRDKNRTNRRGTRSTFSSRSSRDKNVRQSPLGENVKHIKTKGTDRRTNKPDGAE